MALRYARHALVIAIIMGIIYGLSIFTFSPNLVAFFQLGDQAVNSNMEAYLKIIAPGMLFAFLNPTYSGMYNGSGLSRIPFNANAIGLVINIILDPLLIYGVVFQNGGSRCCLRNAYFAGCGYCNLLSVFSHIKVSFPRYAKRICARPSPVCSHI